MFDEVTEMTETVSSAKAQHNFFRQGWSGGEGGEQDEDPFF